jgi:hypothetical protein
MARVRCAAYALETHRYVNHVLPVGYPDSGVICGVPSCRLPGLIWLEAQEARSYDRGERIFQLRSRTIKVRAQ